MTAVEANHLPLTAPHTPDQLGGAVHQSLARPMNPKLTWGPIKTLLLTGLTGGLLPTLVLPKRFRDFAVAEQLQFWHLAEWVRLQSGIPEAGIACDAARRVAPGHAMRIASTIFALLALGIGWTAMSHRVSTRQQPLFTRWVALTLPKLAERSGRTHPTGADFWHAADDMPTSLAPLGDSWVEESWQIQSWDVNQRKSGYILHAPEDLVHGFALAMAGAGLCWLIEVNAHVSRVRAFVGAFNRLSNRYGVGPVRAPGLHLGFRPLWIVGAFAFFWVGGFWAAPVMLAAGAHRSYIRGTSQRLRADLARRQREVLLRQRPTVSAPASVYLMNVCPQSICRAPLPPEATFCRRCGTRVSTTAVA